MFGIVTTRKFYRIMIVFSRERTAKGNRGSVRGLTHFPARIITRLKTTIPQTYGKSRHARARISTRINVTNMQGGIHKDDKLERLIKRGSNGTCEDHSGYVQRS